MCEFETVAVEILEQILTYEHLIVFTAILQKEIHASTLEYISMDDICKRTNLHSRDAMKYVTSLLNNKIIESMTRTFEKKRVVVYGIQYARMFNFLHMSLKNINDNLSNRKCEFYCAQCTKDYSLEECLDSQTLNVQCPIDATHKLEDGKIYVKEKKNIQKMLRQISSLKNKIPLRPFVDYFKRVRPEDESTTDRVVARKSSTS